MTYSVGDELSGVGVYSNQIAYGLAEAHGGTRMLFYYRPHRFLRAWQNTIRPGNIRRRLLFEPLACRANLFHGLNQRLPRFRRRCRTVCTFHDLFVLTGDYSTAEFRARFAEQARQAADRSDAIIAVSRFTADQVVELLGVERPRVHVVHHGVTPRRRMECPAEKRILCVGAIQKRKNMARLVDGFAAVSGDWRLVLAGSTGYGAQEVMRRIEQNPCRERIDVLGYVSHQRLTEEYSRASIFAFPSLDEGFGMPVLEAMAMGLPVLTSNRPALREICGDAAVMVDPLETEAIAASLVRLVSDAGLRATLGEAGRRHTAQFTWEKAVQQTWDIYHRLD